MDNINKIIKKCLSLSIEAKTTNNDEKLVAYVCGLSVQTAKDVVHTVLTSNLLTSKASQITMILFKGMSGQDTEQKRFVVTKQVLQDLKISSLSSKAMREDILNLIILAIDKLAPEDIVTLSAMCIKDIENNSDEHLSWKEVVPKLLNVLEDIKEVTHSGTIMTGAEYKSKVIQSLILAEWKVEILTPLAIAFKHIRFTLDEEMQITNKFCDAFEIIPPEELVPLIRQLLIFCKDRNGMPIFISLQKYFTKWIYKALPFSQDFDGIDEIDFRKDAPDAQANVLLCIYETASNGHPIIDQLKKSIKSVTNAPEKVIEPFLVTVLLSVSQLDWSVKIIDILKTTILRALNEETKMAESAWVRNLASDETNIASVLSQVIDTSHECEGAMRGMIDLAFALLTPTGIAVKESRAEKLCALAQLIFVRVIKKKAKELGGLILTGIYEGIRSGRCAKQLIACLREILRTSPLVVRDNNSSTLTMMGFIGRLSVPLGVDMVKALSPACLNMHASDTVGLRDNLIIILHKDLVNPIVNNRLVAVYGILHMLANVEIRNMGALTQSSCSQLSTHSATRARIEHNSRGAETEVTCMQILRWLTRCLKEQPEVKLALYTGLGKSVSKNPEMMGYGCDMLLDHVKDFYKPGEALPPLAFINTVALRDDGAKLVEPIGNLLLVIHQLITRTDEASTSSDHLTEILDSLVSRMPKCSLEDFQLVDASELLDILPESCQKREITCQIISVYEALMSYVVDSWDLNTNDQGKKLLALFKGYHRVLEFTKSLAKVKKLAKGEGRGKNKSKEVDETQPTANFTKPGMFKPPATIIDFPTVCKMLQLLYEDSVSWSTDTAKNQIMSNHDLRKYVIQVAIELVKQSLASKENQPANLNYFIQIGTVLYQRVICHLDEQIEYDSASTLLCLECFNEVLLVIGDIYKTKINDFVSEIAGVQKKGENPTMKMITTVQKLLMDIIASDADAYPEVKKIPTFIIALLRFLAYQLPPSSEESKKVLDWMKNLATDTEIDNALAANEVLKFLLDFHHRCVITGPLFDSLALQLQSSIGLHSDYEDEDEVQPSTKLAIVTSNNESQAILTLFSAIKQALVEVDWIVGRLAAEHAAGILPKPGRLPEGNKDLKVKERDVCVHLGHCVKVVNILARTNFPEVAQLETAMLRLMMNLYVSLTGLANYFLMRSSKVNPAFQAARFEPLVKLCGNHLCISVNNYISKIQNKDFKEKEKEGKKKSAGTSESRYISSIMLDSKLVSSVTYHKESFEAAIVKLTNKTKINLMQFVRVNGARDFRLNKQTLTSANASVAGSSNGNEDEEEPKKKKHRQK